MLKILTVMPDAKMAELFQEMFRSGGETIYDNYYKNENFLLESVVISHEDIPELKIDVDAVVSRGMMAYELRSKFSDIPVVEIPITGNDIIRSIKALMNDDYNSKSIEIAAIGSTNMIMGIEEMDALPNITIKAYLVESYKGIEQAVLKAAEDGFKYLIGGPISCSIANKLGIHSATLNSSKDGVRHAINEVKRSAYINRISKQKAIRYETILQNTSDGIIAIDTEGKITILNPIARKLLGLSEENYTNASVENITSDEYFNKFLCEDTKITDHIIKYENKYLSCNRIPMFLHNEKTGVVITLQDVEKISNTEQHFRKNIYYKGHVAKYTLYDIIGNSTPIVEMITLAKKYSVVDSSILLVGKTGTGKEMLAQGIHNYSKRSSEPFVAINCAAIPANLLESELFGYVEGAFSGAGKKGKMGLFEVAHGGTIFLDEITELPYELQARLLRVIQEKEVMRLGSDKIFKVDVRILSACNRDLTELVRKNQFREDLYYRINTLRIDLPPLSERKEDIPLIVDSIIDELKKKTGKDQLKVSDETMRILMGNEWPGNVRELLNCCERLAVLSEDGFIKPEHYFESIQSKNEVSDIEKLHSLMVKDKDEEKEKIIKALLACEGRKQDAAEMLNMSRSTLWRKLKEYNL